MIDILPSKYAENLGRNYALNTTNDHKKSNGQYFTSWRIADFMSKLSSSKSGTVSILDPGAGVGILSCTLIETLVSADKVDTIYLTVFETDITLYKELKKVLVKLKSWLEEKDVKFEYSLKDEDFIISKSDVFQDNNLFGTISFERYDYVISNPPYFKISTSDPRAIIAKKLVYGQPNIYALFLGLAAKILKRNGELIFITPRSFAAGNYFKAFRNYFFNEINISHIHIFESRDKMFKSDNVLQENIIIKATKDKQTKTIISVSEGEHDLNSARRKSFYSKELLDMKSKEKILFIPSNKKEDLSLNIFKNWENNLNSYGIQISTGPVVAFRKKEFLRSQKNLNERTVPLIWLHNIKQMQFVFPLKKGDKEAFILDSELTSNILLVNKNYILLRRFSSKDDKSRLVCTPYFAGFLQYDRIGVENHINYIHRPKEQLSIDEIWGISAMFNSTLFDTYFRTFNGNTQVGATELKNISLPPMEKIIEIGKRIQDYEIKSKESVDKVMSEIILNQYYEEDRRSPVNTPRIRIA